MSRAGMQSRAVEGVRMLTGKRAAARGGAGDAKGGRHALSRIESKKDKPAIFSRSVNASNSTFLPDSATYNIGRCSLAPKGRLEVLQFTAARDTCPRQNHQASTHAQQPCLCAFGLRARASWLRAARSRGQSNAPCGGTSVTVRCAPLRRLLCIYIKGLDLAHRMPTVKGGSMRPETQRVLESERAPSRNGGERGEEGKNAPAIRRFDLVDFIGIPRF